MTKPQILDNCLFSSYGLHCRILITICFHLLITGPLCEFRIPQRTKFPPKYTSPWVLPLLSSFRHLRRPHCGLQMMVLVARAACILGTRLEVSMRLRLMSLVEIQYLDLVVPSVLLACLHISDGFTYSARE